MRPHLDKNQTRTAFMSSSRDSRQIAEGIHLRLMLLIMFETTEHAILPESLVLIPSNLMNHTLHHGTHSPLVTPHTPPFFRDYTRLNRSSAFTLHDLKSVSCRFPMRDSHCGSSQVYELDPAAVMSLKVDESSTISLLCAFC